MGVSTAFMQFLASAAPEAVKLLNAMQKEKWNDRQILIGLLALNLESCKKTECMIQELRGLKADMARKGLI